MFSPIGLTLRTGHFEIDRAFRIAMGDMFGNVIHYKSGLLKKPAPCLSAGLSYPDPWTRDTALNTWNGAGVIIPEVMKNTLLSCLTRGDASAGMGEGCNDVAGSKVPPGVLSISGQYWDRVIWAIGAWAFYCQNGDREFLALALEAVRNSLPYLEENEWDGEKQLFRGGACIADGLGAYGDIYSNVKDSGIYQWPEKKYCATIQREISLLVSGRSGCEDGLGNKKIAQHIAACDSCARHFQQMRQISGALRSASARMPKVEITPGFRRREWMLYVQSPREDRKAVEVKVPGFGDVAVDVTRSGAFYHLQEGKKGAARVGIEPK